MIAVDSSAWIEFLRGTHSRTHHQLKGLLEEDSDLALTEIVFMELVAGTRGEEEARGLRGRLLAYPILRLEGLRDYEEAALIYRLCRRSGETPRSLTDCLIAATVIRAGARLLHADSDFDLIARHSSLRLLD